MLIIVWLVLSILVGTAGQSRKIGGTAAFFCAALLSPLVGLLVVLTSDKLSEGRAPAPAPSASATPISVADELTKLKALYDSDVLTRTEYDAQKARLLGMPSPASESGAGSPRNG